MKKFKFLTLSLLIFTANCNILKNKMQFASAYDCNVLDKILNHPEIIRTLLLDKGRPKNTQLRVFYLTHNLSDCNGYVLNWPYQTYDKVRPSVNTGFNRDLFFQIKKSKKSVEFIVYVASHEHFSNRQTTYMLTYIRDESEANETIKLIGFAEYTDWADFDK